MDLELLVTGMGEVPFNKVARLKPAGRVMSRNISSILLHMSLNMAWLYRVPGNVVAWNVMSHSGSVRRLRWC